MWKKILVVKSFVRKYRLIQNFKCCVQCLLNDAYKRDPTCLDFMLPSPAAVYHGIVIHWKVSFNLVCLSILSHSCQISSLLAALLNLFKRYFQQFPNAVSNLQVLFSFHLLRLHSPRIALNYSIGAWLEWLVVRWVRKCVLVQCLVFAETFLTGIDYKYVSERLF